MASYISKYFPTLTLCFDISKQTRRYADRVRDLVELVKSTNREKYWDISIESCSVLTDGIYH